MLPGLPKLRADERLVKRILQNLLSNAIKFTPEGGRVTVLARLNGGYELAVADTVIGIAPEDIERVFAPFGQVDGVLARKHEGTGLGLPLVKSMADLHGAAVELSSAVGAGTTVTVRFPPERVAAPAASPGKAAPPPARLLRAGSDRGRHGDRGARSRRGPG